VLGLVLDAVRIVDAGIEAGEDLVPVAVEIVGAGELALGEGILFFRVMDGAVVAPAAPRRGIAQFDRRGAGIAEPGGQGRETVGRDIAVGDGVGCAGRAVARILLHIGFLALGIGI